MAVVTKTEIQKSINNLKLKGELIAVDLMEVKKTIEKHSEELFKHYDGNTFYEIHRLLTRLDYLEGHTRSIVEAAPNIAKQVGEL